MTPNIRRAVCPVCGRTIGVYIPSPFSPLRMPSAGVFRSHSPTGKRGDIDVCPNITPPKAA